MGLTQAFAGSGVEGMELGWNRCGVFIKTDVLVGPHWAIWRLTRACAGSADSVNNSTVNFVIMVA